MSGPRTLWAITSYFNPMGWGRRLENYRRFRAALGIPLLAVEMDGPRGGELADSDADVLVRVARGDVMWQKERLLNIGLSKLPAECDAVAWIDCDMQFTRADWAAETLRVLRDWPVAQLYGSVLHLPRVLDGSTPLRAQGAWSRSVAASARTPEDARRLLQGVMAREAGGASPGHAVAARREVIERHGLYDRCIVGGGDTAFICAAYGCPDVVEQLHLMNDWQKARYRAWAEPLSREVAGRVGLVRGEVHHLWHGELTDRGAAARHRGLREHDYDPDADVRADDDGPLRWASVKPSLHEYVRSYSASRREDGRVASEMAGPPVQPRIVTLTRRTQPRIIIAQHREFRRDYYGQWLRWVESTMPELRPVFEVHDLPCPRVEWHNVALFTAWLQDPVQPWCMETYEQTRRIQSYCDRAGIPVLNRVERLVNTTKHRGARIMAAAGLRVPRSAPITNHEEFRDTLMGLRLPLFVREDWDHWGPFEVARTAEEARAIDLSQFRMPLAVELVDVRDPKDGLYRKYRYIAAGPHGVAAHLQMSEDWITRGGKRITTDTAREEELAFIRGVDQNHGLFQRARRAMGLEFIGFDYGYEPDGSMIVWEANPLPAVNFAVNATKYRNEAIHSTFFAMTRMYLDGGGLPYPKRMERGLAAVLE
jgi:hypothetical protein